MADSAATEEPKRPPGRPKGYPRTGGRKPGVPNRLPEDLRRYISQRGRPLDLLAAIAAGRKVTAADPADPGRKISVYPSMAERVSAARALLNKLLPDLKATELTGDPDRPIGISDQTDMPDFEIARRIAFIMARWPQESGEPPVLDAPDDGDAAAEFRHAFMPEPTLVEPAPVMPANYSYDDESGRLFRDGAPFTRASSPALAVELAEADHKRRLDYQGARLWTLPPEPAAPEPAPAADLMPFGYTFTEGIIIRDGRPWQRATTLAEAVELARADLLRRT